MKHNDTRSQDHRKGRRGRRHPKYRDHGEQRASAPIPKAKTSLWHKLINFFTGNGKESRGSSGNNGQQRTRAASRPLSPPVPVPVTSPKLYVGNLNYDTTESDLLELFNGVGQVQNAEIVSHRETERSKGFGFVTMLTIEEAVRAVETLHNKSFMGRKLVVNGCRSDGPRDARI